VSLLQLAKPPNPRGGRTRTPENVGDGIRTLISSWPLVPAYVHGKYMDIVAANNLATALCPFSTRGRNAILAPQGRAARAQLRTAAHPRQRHGGPGHRAAAEGGGGP
jgi:MmyB-like transcription regulator ligand binding domain